MSLCPYNWFVCTYLSFLASCQSLPALMLQKQIHPAPLHSVNKVILHLIQISILFIGGYKCSCFVRSSALESELVSCLILSNPWDCNWWNCALKINSEKDSNPFSAAWRLLTINLPWTMLCAQDSSICKCTCWYVLLTGESSCKMYICLNTQYVCLYYLAPCRL